MRATAAHDVSEEREFDARLLDAVLTADDANPSFAEAPDARTSNRRLHQRLSPQQFQWLKSARLKYGPEVRVIDISAGGMLVETEQPLKHQSKIVFELAGSDSTIVVPSRVLRCEKVTPDDNAVRYRGAIAFTRPLTLPDLAGEANLGELVVNDIVAGRGALGQTAAPATAAAPHEGIYNEVATVGATWQKVIVRYTDGSLLKGYTNNFHTSRPQLHLSEQPCSGDQVLVPVARLKAIFFVREFDGDPAHVDQNVFIGAPLGRKVEVTFHDGEVLVGSTMSYRCDGNGFFVQPADPRSNNQRVFVILGSIQHVRFLQR